MFVKLWLWDFCWVVVMRIRILLNGVEGLGFLMQRSGANFVDFLSVPLGTGNDADDCSSSCGGSICQCNDVLIRIESSSNKDPIPPFDIHLGANALGDIIKNAFAELG